MKQIFLSFSLVFFILTSCESQRKVGVGMLKVEAFETKIKEANVQLVDVRTPEEFEEGHVAQAININFQDNFAEGIKKLDKTKPVVVYCRSGARSNHASMKLNDLGFKEIYDLEGGIMAWQAASKEVVKK